LRNRIIVAILISIIISTLFPTFNSFRVNAKNGGHLVVYVVDADTGEGLNEIKVKILWGLNFDKQSLYTTQFGSAHFEIDGNYSGNVLISAVDEWGRYLPESKMITVNFVPWVNTTARVEMRLKRIIPLCSIYNGTYIVSLMLDREVVYYGEMAYLVVKVKSPYEGGFSLLVSATGLDYVASVYGGGYYYFYPDKVETIIIRIEHRGYIHWDKIGNFTLLFTDDGRTLEKAKFSLTFKRNWGYEDYILKVKVVDAETKEIIDFANVYCLWGSTLNRYAYESTFTSENNVASFNLGAYPEGKVRIKVWAQGYISQLKDVNITENPTIVVFELQKKTPRSDHVEPSPYNLWLIGALIAVMCIITLSIMLIIYRKRKYKERSTIKTEL